MGNCAEHPALALALIAMRRGQFDGVADTLRTTEERFASLADTGFRCTLELRLGDLAIEEGRHDDVDRAVTRALELLEGTDDREIGPEVCALGARSLADRAAAASARGMPVDVPGLRERAAWLADRADRYLAPIHGDEGAQTGPRPAGFAAQARAEASRLAGDSSGLAGDASSWAEAEEHWRALHQPYEVAYCRWRQADALLSARSGRRRAERLLLDAWEHADALGAVPLRTRIEELAGRARIQLGGDEDGRRNAKIGEDLGLTAREVEVLGLLAAHRTDGQIAQALYISKKTASVHVSNILRKLDAANRIEAGEMGRQAGLDPVIPATTTA
jgi:DNA-binding CsgD family transcriptional regulator